MTCPRFLPLQVLCTLFCRSEPSYINRNRKLSLTQEPFHSDIWILTTINQCYKRG
jgi:hypothetical protein